MYTYKFIEIDQDSGKDAYAKFADALNENYHSDPEFWATKTLVAHEKIVKCGQYGGINTIGYQCIFETK